MLVHKEAQGVGSGQGRQVAVESSQSHVAKVLEGGEDELDMKKTEGTEKRRDKEALRAT